jgi:hypothetical protein
MATRDYRIILEFPGPFCGTYATFDFLLFYFIYLYSYCYNIFIYKKKQTNKQTSKQTKKTKTGKKRGGYYRSVGKERDWILEFPCRIEIALDCVRLVELVPLAVDHLADLHEWVTRAVVILRERKGNKIAKKIYKK